MAFDPVIGCLRLLGCVSGHGDCVCVSFVACDKTGAQECKTVSGVVILVLRYTLLKPPFSHLSCGRRARWYRRHCAALCLWPFVCPHHIVL